MRTAEVKPPELVNGEMEIAPVHHRRRNARAMRTAVVMAPPTRNLNFNQRVRVTLWVHARRLVPRLDSLAMSGAPSARPRTPGSANSTKTSASVQYLNV